MSTTIRSDEQVDTTVVGVSNRVSRRQAGRWARHDAQQAAYAGQVEPAAYAGQTVGPAGPGAEDELTQPEKLADLKERGVLTEAEFAEQKPRILRR